MTERAASPAFNQNERRGSAVLVLALALILLGVATIYFLAPTALAPRFTMLALALFGVAGIFFLFAYAVGLIQFSNRQISDDLTGLIVETSQEGLLITNAEADVQYANRAYLNFCNVDDLAGVKGRGRYGSAAPMVHLPWTGSALRRNKTSFLLG